MYPFDDKVVIRTRNKQIEIHLKILHTCQLTRLDRFSTIKRYSVRNGGPYLDDDLEFFDLIYIREFRIVSIFRNK